MSYETQKVEQAGLSLKLKVGILVLPYIFAWFTLRDGVSKSARIISFTWMVVILASVSTQGNKQPVDEVSQEVTSFVVSEPAAVVEKEETPVEVAKETIEEVDYEEPQTRKLTELEYTYNKIVVFEARLNNCRRKDHFSSNLYKFKKDFVMAKRLSESGRNPNGHLQVLNRNVDMIESQMSSFGC